MADACDVAFQAGLHIGFGVAASATRDFLKSRIEFPIIPMIAGVNTKNQEAGGEVFEQFVVVEDV
jgi:hypothetical protein